MTTGKIAIPYYGDLTHPASGFERIFFIVEHDAQAPALCNSISIGIWDANQTPLLPAWLHDLGVEQVVCRNRPEKALLETMIQAGIRVFSEGSEAARKLLKQLNII